MTAKHIGIALIIPVMLHAGTAQALPVLQEMALHSMLESTTSVFTTLSDYALQNPDGISNGSARTGPGGITWSGMFGNDGWSYSGTGIFGGMALSMTYSGTLSGSYGGDITMTVHGAGSIGSGSTAQPLLMTGLSTWFYDNAHSDYLDMDFEQETKIGANSRHGWIRGKEKIICFVDGILVGDGVIPKVIAGAPIVLEAVASSGKKATYGAGIGIDTNECRFLPIELFGWASSGKKGSMEVSTTVISLLTNSHQSPPAFPAPPAGDLLVPENLGTLVTGDGNLYADDARNEFRSTGRIDGQTFSGITSSLPEPTSALLVGLGIAGLILTRQRGGTSARPARLH